MFIYKDTKTRKIVKTRKKDEEKEQSSEWKLVNEFRNGLIDTDKIVEKGRIIKSNKKKNE